jgi:hypothetical protein
MSAISLLSRCIDAAPISALSYSYEIGEGMLDLLQLETVASVEKKKKEDEKPTGQDDQDSEDGGFVVHCIKTYRASGGHCDGRGSLAERREAVAVTPIGHPSVDSTRGGSSPSSGREWGWGVGCPEEYVFSATGLDDATVHCNDGRRYDGASACGRRCRCTGSVTPGDAQRRGVDGRGRWVRGRRDVASGKVGLSPTVQSQISQAGANRSAPSETDEQEELLGFVCLCVNLCVNQRSKGAMATRVPRGSARCPQKGHKGAADLCGGELPRTGIVRLCGP